MEPHHVLQLLPHWAAPLIPRHNFHSKSAGNHPLVLWLNICNGIVLCPTMTSSCWAWHLSMLIHTLEGTPFPVVQCFTIQLWYSCRCILQFLNTWVSQFPYYEQCSCKYPWVEMLSFPWVGTFPKRILWRVNICITLLVMLNSARHSAVFQQWLHQQVLLSAVDGSLSGSVPFMESSETSHTTFILWLISSTDFPISFRRILDLHWILISN